MRSTRMKYLIPYADLDLDADETIKIAGLDEGRLAALELPPEPVAQSVDAHLQNTLRRLTAPTFEPREPAAARFAATGRLPPLPVPPRLETRAILVPRRHTSLVPALDPATIERAARALWTAATKWAERVRARVTDPATRARLFALCRRWTRAVVGNASRTAFSLRRWAANAAVARGLSRRA